MEDKKCKKTNCPNRAMKGKEYCNACDIIMGVNTKAGQMRGYKINKWQSRLEDLSEADVTKSLAIEIGIVKMTLEAIVNSCSNENDFLQNSFKISDLAVKIEKLVSSCHRLEKAHGQLLDKSCILQLAGEIIGIIGKHVADKEIVELIAKDIIDVIAKVEPDTDEK